MISCVHDKQLTCDTADDRKLPRMVRGENCQDLKDCNLQVILCDSDHYGVIHHHIHHHSHINTPDKTQTAV